MINRPEKEGRGLRKKVGVFTWCNKGVNYGQVLQAFAMCRLLERMGYRARLVQYRKRIEEEPVNEDLGNRYANGLYEFFWGLYRAGGDFWQEKLKFDYFTAKNIPRTPFCYGRESAEALIEDCQAIVCGSDQIWNPASFDPVYFLNLGGENLKRVSYAPSINDDIDFEIKKHIYRRMAECLGRLDAISVREDIGVSIIEKISGLEAVQVLDPTLLLPCVEWDRVASHRLLSGPYMVCYVLGEIAQQEETILRIAKERGISDVYFINTRNTNAYREGGLRMKALTGIGPEDFVSLIKYADVVFTDSFHATAFSVKYRREFFVFRRHQMATEYGGASRAMSLLRLLHLESRFIDKETETSSMGQIPYGKVSHLLEKERKISYQFLKEALDD